MNMNVRSVPVADVTNKSLSSSMESGSDVLRFLSSWKFFVGDGMFSIDRTYIMIGIVGLVLRGLNGYQLYSFKNEVYK